MRGHQVTETLLWGQPSLAALLLHPACVASPSQPHPRPHRGAGAHPEPPGPSPPASLLSVVCGRAPLLRTAPRTLLSCLRAQSPGEAPPQLAAGALRETLTGRDGGRDFSGASSAVSPVNTRQIPPKPAVDEQPPGPSPSRGMGRAGIQQVPPRLGCSGGQQSPSRAGCRVRGWGAVRNGPAQPAWQGGSSRAPRGPRSQLLKAAVHAAGGVAG